MSNLLQQYGLALRDGVYETFMEVTKTTELKELKEAGFRVDEFPLSTSPASMDKLYVLIHKETNTIKTACSLTVKDGKPVVKVHTPLESKEVLRRVAIAFGRNSNKPIH